MKDSETRSDLDDAPVGDESLAWDRRNHNLEQLWDPLHELGFHAVDGSGVRVDRRRALRDRTVLGLRRDRRALALPRTKVGFFTHSLIGNALVLLTGAASTRLSTQDGKELTLDDLARQPNRHYLSNATPVDLGSVVLIRHGLTQANQQGIALGRSDGAEGWRGELVVRLERAAPADVASWHCSTLVRTQQTARMFGVHDATPHAALDEMDIGAAEGIQERTVIGSFASARLMYHPGDPFAAIVDEFPGELPRAPGECFVEVLLRVAWCLREEIGPM